jgi:predicted CXXCH cytochrome family protein
VDYFAPNRRCRVAAVLAGVCIGLAAVEVRADYAPGTGLIGSPHDFRGSAYATNDDAACGYCHASHDSVALDSASDGAAPSAAPRTASAALGDLPLWNHDLTPDARRFVMYQNGNGAPTTGPKASQAVHTASAPGAASLLCLSCHDGSLSVNAYGNGVRSRDGATVGGAYVIGQSAVLANHHPVGIDYDAARANDNEIRAADVAMLGGAGTVRMHLAGPSNSMLECTSCHSVHNTGNTGERLLWRSDVRSQLCLSCHDKGEDPGAATP